MSPFPNGSFWGSLPKLTARRRGRTRAPETWPTGSACATASVLEDSAVDQGCPRSGKASLDLEGVRLGGAGDRQGGGAHPVRHSRDRGAPDRVGPGSVIREKGDLLHRSLQEAQEAEQARSLSWWYFQENSRFGLSAELPAADGAVVARPWSAWPIISPRCPARIVRLRQLKYRDRECTFTGCGERRFTQAHHIVWWECGGPTDLDNLILVCSFHHKLVHEYGWAIKREQHGTVSWFR